MLDVRRLRQEPESVKAALAKRQPDLAAVVDRVLARDAELRPARTVSMACSTVVGPKSFKQRRWPSGHSRAKHGLH